MTLATSTPGGAIRYTIDGSDPHAGSLLYTQGIVLTSGTTTTVRARTFLGGCASSGLAQATYQVVAPQTTTAPTLSPAPGLHPRDTSITMAVADPFAIIRYTTDGSEPVGSSQQYVGIPIPLAAPLTIKAKAYRPDHDPSATVSGDYTLRLPKPTMTPASGAYASTPTVSMSPDPFARRISTAGPSAPRCRTSRPSGIPKRRFRSPSVRIAYREALRRVRRRPGHRPRRDAVHQWERWRSRRPRRTSIPLSTPRTDSGHRARDGRSWWKREQRRSRSATASRPPS